MEMDQPKIEDLTQLLGHLFKAHPWHGLALGENMPDSLNAYIEIVPTDTVKFEVDKESGHLRVDRPQRYSNICPALYGLIPQTYCGDGVAQICREATGNDSIVGDGDPLDICVLSEKAFSHGDFIMEAIPIGGLRMIDGNEADDKIIAVMKGDASCGHWKDISQVPDSVLERLNHYFLTYKDAPNDAPKICEIQDVYGAITAHDIIRRSNDDYHQKFPDLGEMLNLALGGQGNI